jgi:hypothetical protein
MSVRYATLTRMRTRIAAAVITTAAALALTACSSSSDDKAAPPVSNTAAGPAPAAGKQDPAAADKAALTKAVTDYTAELFAGNPDGYAYLSKRCKTQLTHDEWTALAKQGHHDYGSQKATKIHVDELSGNLARVTYGAGDIPAMDRKGQPWTREGGQWHWDGCQTVS